LLSPLFNGNSEWKNYCALTPELIPGNSVVWTRKGEHYTAAAIDKILRGCTESGWLISTEKKLNIAPASAAPVVLRTTSTSWRRRWWVLFPQYELAL